ncbi:hypothetical protein AB7M56_003878 [Bradyrhizobium elkanii]|jgi:hypothetical protein|nr:hypothetical protein [Bradyrhizobium elkanii]MCS3517061.1 hypothetical protein [Bradyrhizobium elkanii]MCS4073618.1 hypothetical protein [Bradyrhizobium elkanii]MCS4080251.1 hypothetical protein [Bradyrhizobium elkanii]MCW2130169.1 hypothetical protein [Bradyrhizobium elkanii]
MRLIVLLMARYRLRLARYAILLSRKLATIGSSMLF